MKKLLATLLFTALVSGCATSSSISTKNNVSVAKMQISSVKVNLKQKYVNPTFYSQTDIEQYLNKCLMVELSKTGKYQVNSNNNLNVNVDYKRVYVGEAFGMKTAVSAPKIDYSYQISNGNQVLQQKQENDLTVTSGLLGNLKTIATMDLNNTEKSSENSYLDALCKHITDEVY